MHYLVYSNFKKYQKFIW